MVRIIEFNNLSNALSMKLISSSIAFICVFLSLSTTAFGQLFEDFDSGDDKSFYSGAAVSLPTGSWYLDDALLGDANGDLKNGTRSVRLRDGSVYMLFDKTGGADEFSFFYANAGFSGDDGGKIQVQYSIDGGSNWINTGDEFICTDELQQGTVSVQVDGNIRFRVERTAGGRINLDDFLITDYIAPADTATISVSSDGEILENEASIDFGSVIVGSESSNIIELKNVGVTPLVISGINISGTAFEAEYVMDDSLEFNETIVVALNFVPQEAGNQSETITILSNSVSDSAFVLDLNGEALPNDQAISIAEARALPQGTVVTVAGIVTVTDEFQGPVYFQDETGGLAWFNCDLMRGAGCNSGVFSLNVERGDSIIITGELGSFNDLLQLVDSDEVYEFKPNQVEVIPEEITVAEMNSGDFEGQLVALTVDIDHAGALQGNTDYDIIDNTGTGVLYINDDSEIVGSGAPEGETTIVGVVGIFRGTYQILPRDLEDIDADLFEIPGEEVSKDETFEVVTWNIEWFGQDGNGPEDEDIQLANVITVIDSIDADVYALQEISDQTYFNALIDSLSEYEGVLATFGQDQKTAYLYKTETVELLNSGLITSGMEFSDWAAGRYPLLLNVNATINEEVQELFFYNIHAKAFSEASDYQQRINASSQLKAYLDGTHQGQNVIVLGDFNDEILQSTHQGIDSPYKNFDDDDEYTIVSKSLEERGFTSFSSSSMIDHIVFSSALEDEYFVGTERVENPSYIGSYLSQTSDHYPVWVRFQWGTPVSNEIDSNPDTFTLYQNYPNPFNPSTQITYTLSSSSTVSLLVYDVMGRKVASLIEGKNQVSGEYSYTFEANGLASGLYVYQLEAGNQVLTKKMLLVK